MSMDIEFNRRSFLVGGAVATGTLIVGLAVNEMWSTKADGALRPFRPNAFLEFNQDGEILFHVPNAEMGQGVLMGLTTLIAEELNMRPETINTLIAGPEWAYVMPTYLVQITGTSATMNDRYMQLRQMAANVGRLFLQAASDKLSVSIDDLVLRDGAVHHRDQHLHFGQLVARASELPLPDDTQIKPASEFRFIGKDVGPRVDALAKVTGRAEFGLDTSVPDAKIAIVVQNSAHGTKPMDCNRDEVLSLPGVREVLIVSDGVAIVAETFWQAQKARTALEIEWDEASGIKISSVEIETALRAALATSGQEVFSSGDTVDAISRSSRHLSAEYFAPYLAHATMEPMNCTVRIEEDRMEVWIPTQSPSIAQHMAHVHSGIARDQITIHTPLLGGGFGRRGHHDYLAQAVQIAVATGDTIKLIWSREDDMQHDFYRPVSLARFEAGVNPAGQIQGWSVKRAGPNALPSLMEETIGTVLPTAVPDGAVKWMSKLPYSLTDGAIVDWTSAEGLYEDYDCENVQVEHVTVDPGIRCGPWRSVGHSYSGFFKECFMDELAAAAEMDPLAFRLMHLSYNSKLANVLQLAAEKAGWGEPREGQHLGLACHTSFGTSVAQVVETSLTDGGYKIHNVVCAVDCGLAVNPDIVKAQMESGILYGLSAAMYGEVTFKSGSVAQDNFDSYPVVRMDESPDIEIIIVESTKHPTGVGEPGVPPIAAALCNALYAASGTRIRRLPISLEF